MIGYGIVQASAPAYLRRRAKEDGPPDAPRLGGWTAILLVPLAAIVFALQAGWPPAAVLITGLAVFGIVFAVNSAIHSYLIVAYAEDDGVSLAVGFYYTANALGRLLGTILSGAVFQWAGQGRDGLVACILCAIVLVVVSRAACEPLRRAEARAVAA